MISDNDANSDLAVLNERCIKNGISSPVKFSWNGRPTIENRIHIDLYEVFKKEMVKATIFKNKYRTLKLEDVSQGVLGKGKYGSGALSGANVHSLTIDDQKQYVLQDAQLVMDLSNANNGQIMNLMQAISELTSLSLEQVCRSNLSTWWMKVFDNMGCIPSQISERDEEAKNQPRQYQGGHVIEPKRGLYKNLKVVDVVSLYPSVAILHNISFDTVNCACCMNTEDAKVPSEVIDKVYWICKQREGAFPKKLKEFKEERIRQKQLGNEEKQIGLKILINGGYGLFGNPVFKYADIRVAELITAYGRDTLLKMQNIASSQGFNIVAGDTDSLFLQGASDANDIPRFIAECKEKIRMDVEHGQTFAKAVIVKKKHYFGVTTSGEIKVTGMEGKKNDRPLWINKVFDQFLEDFKADRDPTLNLQAAINDLEEGRVDPELLKINIRLAKDPADYAVYNPNKKIGILLGAKAGDVIGYFKTDGNKKKAGVSINPGDISVRKYKEMLMATVKDALEVLGK